MNRYLRILFLLGMLACGGWARAQISFMSWSGNIPATEYYSSCSIPEPMSDADALVYLSSYITFSSFGDCASDPQYVAHCTYDVPHMMDICHVELVRRFSVWDECNANQPLEFQQTMWIDFIDETLSNDTLPMNTVDAYDFDLFLPNETSEIDAYLAYYGVQIPSCWTDHVSSYSKMVNTSEDCAYLYHVIFTLQPVSCELQIKLYQDILLQSTAPIETVEMNGNNTLTPMTFYGCDGEDLIAPRPIEEIDEFENYGITFTHYLSKDFFDIESSDEFLPGDDCTSSKINRHYVVTYYCTNQTFDLYQEFTVKKRLSLSGQLEKLQYEENESIEPFTSVMDLKENGIYVKYSCDLSDLVVTSYDEFYENQNGNGERHYIVKSGSCSEICDTLIQYMQKIVRNPKPFMLEETQNVTMEGMNDGIARIRPATHIEFCPSCPQHVNKIFQVEWVNNTTGQVWLSNPDDDGCDIFYIDSLTAGNYDVRIYPICPDFDWEYRPIFSKNFDIAERKMSVTVTDGPGLYSGHSYVGYLSVVSVLGANNEYIYFSEYDQIMGRFNDEWELATGKLYSPNKKEWDLYEMYNPTMGGYGAYENMLFNYQNFNELYGHGLQRMIVAKDESYSVTYRMYKKRHRDNELGTLFKEYSYPVYREQLWCSNDPNEIFGPAGYTNADSTVVRMINADDDMIYTIQFENDPEFATAAAARVKVTCPLDEHADPTTFRLGNFGFGEYTFEVPPMASYYNNRINMDSLGYWLDVTASIQVPENEAYWIFQTIDPATGVAPVDSLGFLPVNDTLTGVGEGFVTFTVSPKPGASRSVIQTGDTIVEQAQIIFDENETVPTNRYKNTFDAVAPTSTIVCDTTGAYQSKVLNIGFSAADDPEGSGVKYVELYANVDLAGYERIAQMHPDSLFPYALTDGTNFEFMCLAVDNVNNKEPYKAYHELFYCLGNPPRDLELSNNVFEENDAVGTLVGNFITYDDQNTDNFVYALVDGVGGTDNSLFRIEGDQLKTNYDFRCYGDYEYSIRVRTTDITNAYLEKTFTILAHQTETQEPVMAYHYLCPGEGFYFNGRYITEPDVYVDTLSSQMGCDSIVRMIVHMNPDPVTTEVDDAVCFGDDYTENGFSLSADSLAILAQGWTMEDDLVLYLDNYKENAFSCFDTTRLALTLRPSYARVDEVSVCATELPYVYHERSFSTDTTFVLRYQTQTGCDSIFTLQLTVDTVSTQSDNLAGGWNWYSTYIDQSNGQGLSDLENALGTHGMVIKSKDKFVQYNANANEWFGNLTELDNKSMYMIQTDAAHETDLSGCQAGNDSIALHSGWSWVGFPMSSPLYVSQMATAVSGYPTEGDIFKSSATFAMYYADYGIWYGSLSVLQPGQGYMYLSNSNTDKYLYYPNASRTEGHPVELPEVHWVNDAHRYAENITFLGLIELDGQSIESDTLEVGAFCNGEERGSGRALYLQEMDAYRIFLTVKGHDGDVISFRLFDHNRDKERRIRCRQQVAFHADDHYGDLKHPYVFRFATDYDKLIEAEICEGQYYVEHGFRVHQPGTYFKEMTGQHGNDSIVRLDLTVNPVYHAEEAVVAEAFPFHYQDKVFDKAGIYTLNFKTEHGCDSVLVVTVVPYEGVRELLVSPVPAERGDRVTLYFPFTPAEQEGLLVEVFTLSGSLMQSLKPTRYPIELDPLRVSGTYMVKITMGTGEVLTGKIIIR